MNPELPIDPRQALEASLTAMLLGELPPDQVEFMERVLANDAGLRTTYEQLKQTLEFIREAEQPSAGSASPATEPLKLSDTRRTQLLQHFKTIRQKQLARKPQRRVSPVLAVAAVLVLGLMLTAMLLPAFSRAKSRGMHSVTPLAGHPISAPGQLAMDETAASDSGRFQYWSLNDTPVPGNAIANQDRAGSAIVLPKGGEVENRSAPESQVALGFVPQSQPQKQVLIEQGALRSALVPPAQSDAFIVPSTAPAEQTKDAGALKYQDFDRDAYSVQLPQSLAEGHIEQFSRRRLQEGLPNGAQSITRLPSSPPPAPAAAPAPNRPQSDGENMARFRARYGLARGSAVYGGFNTTKPADAGKREIAQEQRDKIRTGGDAVTGLPAMETAVSEAVTRQSDRIRERQKVADELARAERDQKPAAGRKGKDDKEEPGRIPILGDKPLIGRGYGEQSSKGGVEFIPQKGIGAKEMAGKPTIARTDINALEKKMPALKGDARSIEQLADDSKAWIGSSVRGFYDDNLGTSERSESKSIRTLKVDRNKFEQGLEAVSALDLAGIAQTTNASTSFSLGGITGGQGGLTVPRVNVAGGQYTTGGLGGGAGYGGGRFGLIPSTNQSSQIAAEARQLFASLGVNLNPPNALFWNEGEGTLVVRASPQELDAVQAAIDVLSAGGAGAATNLQQKVQTSVSSEEMVHGFSRTNLIFTSDARKRLYSKLDNIRLDSVSFDGLPLTDVVKILNEEAQRRDPEKRGINFLVTPSTPNGAPDSTQPVAVDPTTGLPVRAEQTDLSQVLVKIVPPLRDVSLSDVLDAIVKVADAPIQFSVEDYAVVCSPRTRNTPELGELKIDLGKLPTNTTTNQQTDVAAPKAASPPPTPQPEIDTRENAFSTFSLNVSDVSFKLAAASLEKGVLPDPAGIRSEEFINAFDYHDPEPPAGMPVGFVYDRSRYPFAINRELLRFSIKTAAQGRETGRPLNLVILLDNSGSMERADRVQIIREALHVLAGQLNAHDKLSLITFARTAQLRADGVSGTQATNVADEASELTPQGGTNLEEAMNLAYETARKHYLPKGINRVVLLTDGAANLGDVEPESLKKKVEEHRRQGIALDCFGIGWEGYNDDLLEVLSRNGDGRYGFINTPEEASTEFVSQLAGALHVAASDVKVQVEFNPSRVANWRQIGYAKHQLTKEQFRDNTVDAAELGAAESGNALYVVETLSNGQGPLAIVRVRYKVPGTQDYHEHEWAVPYNGNAAPLEQAAPTIRLAAVASGFSEWLATNPFAADITLDSLLGYLRGIPETYAADPRPEKLQWMLRQAKSLSGK